MAIYRPNQVGYLWNFQENLLGCPKMIQHSKVDQIILNSSQEPPTSSKYDRILDALLITLVSWKLAYNSRMTYNVYSWCNLWYQSWSNPPRLESGTINILQVWLCSWCTYNHARELKILTQLRNDKLCWFRCDIWYQRGSNPPKLQSGSINILHVWLCSWCMFNHTRELKIGMQLNHDIWWLFVMSNLIPNMTKSSKTPVRNHQCPQSMTLFLMHF